MCHVDMKTESLANLAITSPWLDQIAVLFGDSPPNKIIQKLQRNASILALDVYIVYIALYMHALTYS